LAPPFQPGEPEGATYHGQAWCIALRAPRLGDHLVDQQQQLVVVVFDDHCVVTLHPGRLAQFPQPLVVSLRPIGGTVVAAHPECVAYALLAHVGKLLLAQVAVALAEVRNLDDLVLAAAAKDELDFLERISQVRLSSVELQGRLLSHQDVCRSLVAAPESVQLLPEVLKLVKESLLAQAQGLRELDGLADMLEQVTALFLGRISLDSNVQSFEAGESMRRFTAIATIMLPLLFVQGLFSMNIGLPGKGVNNTHWFWGINTMSVTICIVLLLLLKYIKWL